MSWLLTAGTWYGKLLRHYLWSQGFHPYPREFLCHGEPYGYVDAAAEKAGAYYAFEFKSWNDWIGKGIEQCRCYARWFDYAVLVCERDPMRRTKSYAAAQTHGIGVWTARRLSEGEWQFRSTLEPRLQSVVGAKRASVVARFRRAILEEHRNVTRRGPLDVWCTPSPGDLKPPTDFGLIRGLGPVPGGTALAGALAYPGGSF